MVYKFAYHFHGQIFFGTKYHVILEICSNTIRPTTLKVPGANNRA